jgi:glucose-6-phosphate 1-dehydrogenase
VKADSEAVHVRGTIKKKVGGMEVPSIIFVIFGGAGDLTWRKLVPSLFDLHRDGRMPKKFAIIAVDRVHVRDTELHKHFLDVKVATAAKAKSQN